LNGRVQYRVPLFQRQYAWQKEQRQQLWSDIVDLYDERMAGTGGQHFMGSIVTAPEQLGPNRPSTHTLIDGQQRMTTLTVLLAAPGFRSWQAHKRDSGLRTPVFPGFSGQRRR
ncbi:MAG: DUF262 domain-containing protein, partial [Chloroflexota bacterium]|nr:DUF262 domain-containing protein [Chloroflexota bacterium]